MIKINLAPTSELENPYWWLPDLLILLVVAGIGWAGVTMYSQSVKIGLEALTVEKRKFDKDYDELAPKLESFKNLTALIKDIEDKEKSVSKVRGDDFTRYRPVLALEVIQALKPEGAWINKIISSGDGSKFTISGVAFNNAILSEFITNLESLNEQKQDPLDLRTFVRVENIVLERSVVGQKDVSFFDDAKNFPMFDISFSIKKAEQPGEKKVEETPK